MTPTTEDQVMHALELASAASKRKGKWATPSEVAAFGKTGEVGLRHPVNTDDLDALVREGKAESTIAKTDYLPEEHMTLKQILYRPNMLNISSDITEAL